MKMYKTKKLLGLSLIAMSVAGTAQAGEWSAGLNVGQATSGADGERATCELAATQSATINSTLRSAFSCDVDDSDTSVGLNIGYNFTNTWGVELGYVDLGDTSSTLSTSLGNFITTGTNSVKVVDVENSSVYFVGTGNWSLSDKWSLTGRLGVAKVDYDITLPGPDVQLSDDVTEAMAGFSLNYHFNANWSADIRYDYFNTGDDIDNVTLGIRYSFKK